MMLGQTAKDLMAAQKLRFLLARAEVKHSLGQPLTIKEEQLLFELYRRRHMKPREQRIFHADGQITISRTVDAEPVMDAMRAYGDFIDSHARRKASKRMIGSIDPITAANWQHETGLKIGTKEFAKFAGQRIKSDIDYRKFRVGH